MSTQTIFCAKRITKLMGMALLLALVSGYSIVEAGQARISKSFAGMTLAGDGVWEINSPVWIDDVLEADGYDANLDTTFDPFGVPLNVFTIIDSSTYNLFDDVTTGSAHHTAGAFLSVAPVTIGAEDAPTTGNRLSQTASAADFVLTGDTDTTATINFDNLVDFQFQAGISFVQGQDDFEILIQNLCFTSNDDGGVFTGGGRTAMIKSFAPFEADALLPIFKDCAIDANRAFYSVSHIQLVGPQTNNFKASDEIDMDRCGFRYNRFNAGATRVTDPGMASNRNRSHHIYSNAFLSDKVNGLFSWEACTFVGVLQTDFPVGSSDPGDDLDPQLLLWSVVQGDDNLGPAWEMKRSIMFNMRAYRANGQQPIFVGDMIEWDERATPANVLGGAAAPGTILLEDPMFVDVTRGQPTPTGNDIRNAFNTQAGSSAKDPNSWGFADGGGPVPPASVQGWILY